MLQAALIVLRPNCRKPPAPSAALLPALTTTLRPPPVQLAISHVSPWPRQLELIALAIWTIRPLARLVVRQDLLPFGRINLARLLENHHRASLVDDGHMREFLGVKHLGNLLSVLGRHVDVA